MKFKQHYQKIKLNTPGVQLLDIHTLTKKNLKNWKKSRNKLKGAKKFSVKGKTVTHSSGAYIRAVAICQQIAVVKNSHSLRRFMVLRVYHLNTCLHYAIPINMVDSCPKLPELDLSKRELDLIYKISKELMTYQSRKETVVHINSQEKEKVKKNRNQSYQLDSNEEIVSTMLKENHWLLTTMAELILVNLRPWIPRKRVPNYFTTFVSSGNSDVLFQILSALNLSETYVPVINIENFDDLADWKAYGSQLTLVKTDNKMRKKLLKQGRKDPFEGHLFFLAKKKCDDISHVHISIPANPAPLTDQQQDACRAFMAKLLECPKNLVERVFGDYEKIIESPITYRIKEKDAWHQVIEAIISDGLSEHCEAVKMAQEERQAQEEKSMKMLEDAVNLVLDPNRYLEGIATDWPADEEGVKVLLSNKYALYKEASKGEAKFLAFTKDSLTTLCQDLIGLLPAEIDLLLYRLQSQGVVKEKTTPTYLPCGKTLRMIRVNVEMCVSFSLTPLSPQKEASADAV